MTTREELLRRIEALEEKAERLSQVEEENKSLKEELAKVEEIREDLLNDVKALQNQIQAFAGFRDALRTMVGDILEERLQGITDRFEERLQRLAEQASIPGSKLEVDVEQTVLEVNVHRETVTAEESTLRGQIALLIHEHYFDDTYRSGRSVGRELRNLGVNISETSSGIIEELNWFTRQRILLHDDKHGWKLANPDRVRVKEA